MQVGPKDSVQHQGHGFAGGLESEGDVRQGLDHRKVDGKNDQKEADQREWDQEALIKRWLMQANQSIKRSG
jgi:hypothetical protein